MAVWAFWKAHLAHSFDEPISLWEPAAAQGLYHNMVKKHIGADRATSVFEKYQGKSYNAKVFLGLWGEHPRSVKVRQGPKYLQSDTPIMGEMK